MRKRWVAALLMMGIGAGQALDSGVASAGTAVIVLTALAIAMPTGTILLTSDVRLRLTAVVMCGVVLTIARMVSPVSLNTLHLIMLAAAIGSAWGTVLGKPRTA